MRYLSRAALAAVLCSLADCGGGGGRAPDAAVAPTVIATSPADQATGVDPGVTIEATFSDDMNAATLDPTTFVVTLGGVSVAGTVSYTEATRVATFRPASGLGLVGLCTATITTGATSLAGTPLTADSAWTFRVRDGQWGTAQMLEPDIGAGGYAESPQVAVDSSGSAVVVWDKFDGTRTNIWASRFVPGSGWGTSQLIETDNAGAAAAPQVAVDPSGDAIAVWEQSDGTRYNIWANRFVSASGWGSAQLIETDNAGDAHRPQVAFDPSGNAIAVWEQSDGTRYNIWANRFVPASGWGTAQLIETDNAGDAVVPQLAVDTSGNATAVWTQSDGALLNIWANRFVPASGWGTAQLIETDNAGTATVPQVTVDPSGNAIAIWEQSDGTRLNVRANRFVPGSGWGTAQLVETDSAGNATDPQVAVDPTGVATAIWAKSDGTRQNIWANRFLPGWGTPTLLETDNAGDASAPQIAVDPVGNATTVWYQSDGTHQNIWANRFVFGVGWQTATLLETDNAGDALDPQVAVAPSGYATAVWYQFDGTRQNIWANSFR